MSRIATPVSTPLSQWAPWTDRRGRFDPTRAVMFALLLLPAAWLAARSGLTLLGARPLNAAIHSTGYWSVIFLVASLVVSPAKAIFGLPQIAVLRRMIGNAALGYAVLHLLLYCADQSWRPVAIVGEIVQRFYLTIGFVALVGLAVLGATSTDDAIRRMGARWKRLHRLVYALTALVLFHFILQTKADVSGPLLFVGLFFWLMIWRQMPAGKDRTFAGLLLVGLGAAVLTLATEWLWYRFGTRVDPNKMLLTETDFTFGLGPGDQVMLAGLCVLLLLWLRRLSQGRAGQSVLFWIGLFAAGAAVSELVAYVFGIDRFIEPDDWAFLYQDLSWAVLLGVLGFLHWRLRESARLRAVDGLALCCIAFQITLTASSLRAAEIVLAATIVLLWIVLAWQTWRETKLTAISLVPLALVLAYGVMSQV